MIFNSNGILPMGKVMAGYEPLEAPMAPKLLTNNARDEYTGKLFFRAVKLTAFFILMACLQVRARTEAQPINISVKNSSLQKLFTQIERQTSYVFFYNEAILKDTKPVTIEMTAPVEDILKASFKGQGLGFLIQDKGIFVKKEEVKIAVAAAVIEGGPTTLISGVVKSESGAPLGGATVYIKKLKKAGITNAAGEFTIKDIPNGEYEVEISFIGYERYITTITVENHEARVVAEMKQTHSSLDETVVKGYYNTTNRLNTGNVTTVKGEDLQKQPVSDPMMALEGRVPGLYISQASGISGANLNIQLRGQNSIANGNNPLYIVDGVPFTSTTLTSPYISIDALGGVGTNTNTNTSGGISPFSVLNPTDIESIVILKDADATAIYGSRGANGVILITTRKGKVGTTRIDANVYTGAGKIVRKVDMLNTQEYLKIRHEGFYNDSLASPAAHIVPGPSDYDINGNWDTTRYTDWQKVLIGGTSHFTNAQLSLSGGNAYTDFLLGGGYSKQTTVFPGNYLDQKASLHLNLNHSSSNQKFHALFTAQYVNDNNTVPYSDFTKQINLAPDAPALYDANGNINWQKGTWTNPLSVALTKSQAVTDNLIGNLNFSLEILPGLQLKSSMGYTHMQMNQSLQHPATATYGPPSPTFRSAYSATSNINTWIIEPQINYIRRLGQGKLDVLLGSTFQQKEQNTIGEFGSGFASDALITNIVAASTIRFSGSNYTDYRYNALFARLGYAWQEKYMLNLTARRDGSSRFGSGNQFGNFGAIGASWIFSKEALVQRHLRFLTFGKLRASYGTTGNDQIADYQSISSYSNYSTTYQGIVGLYPTRIANPYFGWEEVKKLEAGIDLGFYEDRILINADYYYNRTGNQLVGQTLPSIDGFTTIQENLPAIVQNTGLEFGLSMTNIKSKRFSWTTTINLSIPNNKLISYPNLASSTNKNKYAIGQPLSVQYLYHFTGVNPQTGLYRFQDINKDGVIDSKDYKFSKPVTQNYFGGFQNDFSYKGWQLEIFFQFVKQTGYNYFAAFPLPPGYFNANQPTYVNRRWHNPGDITGIMKPFRGSGDAQTAWVNATQSDYIIGDASFIRLKNLSISYALPAQFQHKMHIQSSRVYIQCQNLLIITGYKGLDPETQGLVLPPLRMITGGIQVVL